MHKQLDLLEEPRASSKLSDVSGATRPRTFPPEGQAGLAEHLLHFLGSLGQPSEAELYLRVYRSLPKGRFALLVPSRGVLSEHAFSLAEQLGFIRELGLSPSLLVGAIHSIDEELVTDLVSALEECGFSPHVQSVDPHAPWKLLDDPPTFNGIPIVWSRSPSDTVIREMVDQVRPQKLVFLRRDGGLGPHGGQPVVLSDGHFLPTSVGGINVVNLRRDAHDLMPLLSAEDQAWLERCKVIFDERPPWTPRATISIASPLSLLRELFTEKGEGTLVKQGAQIQHFEGYHELDKTRLAALLHEAFGRAIKGSFFQRPPSAIFVEREFRGVALLEPGAGAVFLSKLAVLPVARGEGVGQDLWWELSKSHRSIYLRARPQNPITAWYAAVCDGMQRAGEWNIYWKGVEPDLLPGLIRDALNRQEDFETSSA